MLYGLLYDINSRPRGRTRRLYQFRILRRLLRLRSLEDHRVLYQYHHRRRQSRENRHRIPGRSSLAVQKWRILSTWRFLLLLVWLQILGFVLTFHKDGNWR